MSRYVVSFCLTLVLSFVCQNLALGDAQIGDWEMSMDGWESWNPHNIISYSTVGVTSGSYSLRVDSNKPSSNYWYSTELNYKFIGEEARNEFFDSWFFGFYIDVTTLASEWLPNTNAGWVYGTDIQLIINAGDNEGNTMWSTAQTYSTQWDPSVADFSSTFNFNYANQINTLRSWGLDQDPTKGWIEFVLLMRYPTFESPPDGTGDGGVYYLDNAWLWVPEPTSIALLALGTLALFRKKK